MKSSGRSRVCARRAGSSERALRRYPNASLSRSPALASSTGTRSSKRRRSWPSMTIWPQAWHLSAGSCAVKVWPHASMLSSSVMATIFCRSQRPHVFTARLPRSPGCLGKGWERQRKGARAIGMAACNPRNVRSPLPHEVRVCGYVLDCTRFAVDPRIPAALLADGGAIQEVLRHHVAHGSQDRGADSGMLAFQLREQSLHPLALKVLLRAAEIAGDDREFHLRGKGGDLALRGVTERPDD